VIAVRERETSPPDAELAPKFRAARTDGGLAILEGFHAIKHAIRFGAEIDTIVTRDHGDLLTLSKSLAPDVIGVLEGKARTVEAELFAQLSPTPPDSGVIAIARRRPASAEELLRNQARTAPAVLLENPAHRGNVGAAIRVAAAAGASTVITTGPLEPWDPAVVRGSAGLHYALDVARAETLADASGPLIALHPGGRPLGTENIPDNSILAFGSERRGLSSELLAVADRTLAIPMEPHVSSLNLATAVAVVLYVWRLARR
jgi:tRNA G18 (ribose-2'-O)-methylase SpoU